MFQGNWTTILFTANNKPNFTCLYVQVPLRCLNFLINYVYFSS